ncbi:cGMP-dependent protein kinase 2-like isoform X2 [Rhinatrema bivittatum]|uniref:cGMP-dependent protein kinase 2-like isoform X2 n=1 Tax=Rhinatrema bivittatum TaxID=194408 RepID=UPI001125F325|nr:cGMP-dependent protein kinase 2-like isoform X2 [Rhinatrema bivittatum]
MGLSQTAAEREGMDNQLRWARLQVEKQYLQSMQLKSNQKQHCGEQERNTLHEDNMVRMSRGQPIVPEPLPNITDLQVPRSPKSSCACRQIAKAIQGNEVLKRLGEEQLNTVVESFTLTQYRKGETVISEGAEGNTMYIIAEGELHVTQHGQHLRTLLTGDVFGELAILYNCKRTATVTAATDVKLWKIDRQTYRTIVTHKHKQRRQEILGFLKESQTLNGLCDTQLSKIIDSMEERKFHPGDVIVQEGDEGKAFFIILKGEVQVTKKVNGSQEQIRIMRAGEHFGGLALIRNICRTATCRALGDVTCITMNKEDFEETVPFDTVELPNVDLLDIETLNLSGRKRISFPESPNRAQAPLRLQDLVPVLYSEGRHQGQPVTLGTGGFGRVELVSGGPGKPVEYFALKKIRKLHVVQTRQEEHVKMERQVLLQSHSPFIVRLFETFRDSRYVYMALEFCEGGELWTKLREVKYFSEEVTIFCIACVVEALEYLHSNGIVYRDLKPENLMLDKHGYVKLVDFGFAKLLLKGEKTYSFCGTPEYLAPEILRNEGHDFAVDFWMLGILIFELLVGRPPFFSSDHRKIYSKILDGEIYFPTYISEAACSIISKLCRNRPGQRLGNTRNGVRGIKKHRWFNKLKWKKLAAQQLSAPTVQLIRHGSPYVNFKWYSVDTTAAEEEFSGWDEDF